MPITKIHCSRCGTEFVDARSEVRAGDEAVCPHCGVHHVFEAGIPGVDEDATAARESEEAARDLEE